MELSGGLKSYTLVNVGVDIDCCEVIGSRLCHSEGEQGLLSAPGVAVRVGQEDGTWMWMMGLV